ncbi:MAG: hypothetical protein AB8I08_33395 [Sandaracinaceae bacterium]
MRRVFPFGVATTAILLAFCIGGCEEPSTSPDAEPAMDADFAIDAGGARDGGSEDAGGSDAGPGDAGQSGTLDAGPLLPEGTLTLIGVGAWGLRGVSEGGSEWAACGNPSTGDDHSPDLLRNIGYGDGVFIAVGGDRNAMVMRSLDGVHWEVDLHPTDACDEDPYPASCGSWMGGVAYGDGVWLAGGGNGALMRSTDGGQTWAGLHPDPRPGAVRSIAYGSGRFVAGTGTGSVFVSADRGETWTTHPAAEHASRVSFGAGAFIVQGRRYNGEGFDYGCAISVDGGDNFSDCPSALVEAGQAVHDGTRWVAPTSDGYLESIDGVTWTAQIVDGVPANLTYAEGAWFGRSGGRVSRSVDLSTWTELTREAPGFRAWVGGRVLDRNLPVEGVPACEDNR